jgi:hypothetical protein
MENESPARPLSHLDAVRLVYAQETAQAQHLLKALEAVVQQLTLLVDQLTHTQEPHA